MIVPMKKYTFLIYHKDFDQFLNQLCDQGVLDVIVRQTGALDKSNELLQQTLSGVMRLREGLTVMESLSHHISEPFYQAVEVDGMHLLRIWESLIDRRGKIVLNQGIVEKTYTRIKPWGHFSGAEIQKIESVGWKVGFYSCQSREFKPEWEETYYATVVAREGSVICFITFSPEELTVDIEAESFDFTHRSLAEIEEQYFENREMIAEIDDQLKAFVQKYYLSLRNFYLQLSEKAEFSKIRLGTQREAGHTLCLLEGWVPEEQTTRLNEQLHSDCVYFQVEDPAPGDKVPVLLKNNRFARLFEPIGEMYDLPVYGEVDLTPLFAPFFVLFFGICVGDAGYGLLLMLAAVWYRRKAKPSFRPVMTLAIWLGAGAVVFGSITGTFFGISLLEVKWSWIQNARSFMLDSGQLFNFALAIGAVQIVFGIFVKAMGQIKRFGFAASLATWGWLILIVGEAIVYALKHYLYLSDTSANRFAWTVAAIAGLFIFLLNDLKRNPLINVGAGLWNAYNMLTGLIGDLLSYIRLFALGLTGSIMGLVFNNLAVSLSGDIPVISHLAMILILAFGHSLNIFMSMLGGFVHPMRLTFVEFYKNCGFEGGGKKYKPFKRTVSEHKSINH